MVKSKSKEVSMFDFYKSICDFKLFTKSFSTKNVIVYSVVMLAVFAILNVLTGLKTGLDVMTQIQVSLIGVPIFLFSVFVLFYLFLSAFEGKSLSFWKGTFVFSTVMLHYMIVGNVLLYLLSMTYNEVLTSFLAFLIFLVIIYLFVSLIIHLKNFYKVSWIRVLTSFILVDVVFGLILILQYFRSILIGMGF